MIISFNFMRIVKSFIISGMIYMFIGVLLGGVLSSENIGEYAKTDKGHWLEAEHTFINFIGFISFTLMGILLYLIPNISGKKLYSQKLSMISFVLLNFGLIFMAISIFFIGIYPEELFISKFIMVGGILLTIGFFIYGYNILKSL